MFEWGTLTEALAAMRPLRMTVSMSAMGSVQLMSGSLPAGLGHAGQRALVAEQAQRVAADAELAQVGAAAAGELAAVAHARGRAVRGQQRERGARLHALLERQLDVLRADTQR